MSDYCRRCGQRVEADPDFGIWCHVHNNEFAIRFRLDAGCVSGCPGKAEGGAAIWEETGPDDKCGKFRRFLKRVF